jgi:hypothetical protein
VDQAVIAESARWGSYRNNPPFTRDRDWAAEQKRLVQSYFPRRTGIVLEQLRAARLFPSVAAPILALRAGEMTLNAASGGKIYYATNGLDPRVPFTGAIAPHAFAYSAAVPAQNIRARAWNGGVWSALVEAAATLKSATP